jgi:phage I-like protein
MRQPSLCARPAPSVLQAVCIAGIGHLQRLCISIRLANTAADFSEKVEGVSNDFQPLQGDWVQVSPYGQFPHPRGMQYFAKADAETIVNNFNLNKQAHALRFGGLPWYEGHPDTSPKDYPNKKAFGWVDKVEARSDGLYGHVKWTKAGHELINEGHYKYFSPVWDATPASVGGKAVLRPDHLISVGFTNTPNMPVLPLSNEAEDNQLENEMKLPPHLKKLLGFADDATPDDETIETAAQEKAEELNNAKKKTAANEAEAAAATAAAAAAETTAADGAPTIESLGNEKTALSSELENAKTSIKNLGEQLDTTAKAFDAERDAHIELLVANQIANGRITKADAEKWKAELKADFPGKSVELANVKPALSNEVITKDLGKTQAALQTGATPRQQARALANEMVTAQGIKFEVAWGRVKSTRPDLFAGMKQPAAPGKA